MNKFRLTKTQEQFWILQNIFKDNTAYNTYSVQQITGNPDIDFLNKAYQKVIERHEIFRSVIVEENNQPWFKIRHSANDFIIEKVIIKGDFDGQVNSQEIDEEIHKPFVLSEDQLVRIKLFEFSNNTSILTIVSHHVVADQESKEIFTREFSELYNSCIEKKEAEIPGDVAQFRVHSEKCHNWLNTSCKNRILDNWKNYLKDGGNPLALPSDYKKPNNLSLNGERLNFEIPEDLTTKINQFSKKNGLSSFVVLLGIYSVFLSRLGNTKEFTIGIPLTNRRHKESKNVIGCCINIVPLKINIREDSNSIDLMKQLRREMIFILRNQELPLLEIMHDLRESTNSTNGIFQTGFTFENPMELKLKNVKINPLKFERKGSQLELFLSFYERDGKFHGTFEFATDLYKIETIQHWKELFISLLGSVLKNPEKETGKLEFLTTIDKKLLTVWNATKADYENSVCLHEKFENQVNITPHETALTYYNQSFTYNELNIHSNRLAHFLIDNGLKIEDKVGICINRSPEMIIAILATLKAGGAYVPFDTNAPVERNQVVSDDAEIKFILSTKESGKNLGYVSGIVYLDDIFEKNISDKITNPVTGVNSGNLAYIIYTSGSTGKPKGVMIEHHSVMNKIGWIQKRYPVNHGETIIQKTPTTFDVSVWELFWWFFNGAKLDLLQQGGEKDPKLIVDRINVTNPALLIFVPSVFSLFIDYLVASKQEACLSNIRWIILIGEALPSSLVNRYNKIYAGKDAPKLVNTYGPTEATVAVSWFECPRSEKTENVFIGKPIDNTKLLIIKDNNQIQPIGVPGELVITGANLARGYQKAPELTSSKFITITLPDGNSERAYKTGDLAQWDVSGELDFIGRVDNQVKIRGMRIELGDIESKLLEHPFVNEAAVIVTKGKSENKILLGYVVSSQKTNGKISQVKDFLHKKLPPHMIPTQLIELDAMPLTSSGKINRKLLPIPDFNSAKSFVPPSSKIESELVEIWKDLLNLENISINDNFFELGGDSMLAVSMVTNIQNRLNIAVDVLKVLEFPNINSLAGFLSDKETNKQEISSDIEKRAMMRKKQSRAKSRRFN